MTDTESKIAGFLKDSNPSAKGGADAILSSRDLFADGWMDSLLHLKLLAFLEKNYGVRVAPLQATRKSFLTVGAIAALVKVNK
ncbi:MAG: hypothetical protein ACXVB9_06930 [Bdellovibrionota bacterium]